MEVNRRGAHHDAPGVARGPALRRVELAELEQEIGDVEVDPGAEARVPEAQLAEAGVAALRQLERVAVAARERVRIRVVAVGAREQVDRAGALGEPAGLLEVAEPVLDLPERHAADPERVVRLAERVVGPGGGRRGDRLLAPLDRRAIAPAQHERGALAGEGLGAFRGGRLGRQRVDGLAVLGQGVLAVAGEPEVAADVAQRGQGPPRERARH
jgi:hypothetical protein